LYKYKTQMLVQKKNMKKNQKKISWGGGRERVAPVFILV
jgi:hypothetical protein